MKKIISLIFLLPLIAGSFTSCQKEEEIGRTAVQELAGDWFVSITRGEDEAYDGHFSTYNTASNSSTEMWLDDLGTFWEFKGKVNVDIASKTFSTDDFIPNEYYDSQFSVAEGKIIIGGTKGPGSGAVTDSIYFEIRFDDDGTDEHPPYIVSGYRKTGFVEDEQ